jgi:hypothetical protein
LIDEAPYSRLQYELRRVRILVQSVPALMLDRLIVTPQQKPAALLWHGAKKGIELRRRNLGGQRAPPIATAQ